jgi:hypothetical protein
MVGADDNNNAGASGDEAEEEYTPVLFQGGLPGATGHVAPTLDTIPLATQRDRAIQFYEFLINPESQMLQLNIDNDLRTVLIQVPNSSKVRLLYGGSFGASGIGATSPVDNKFLFMTGDGGGDIGLPTPIVLPASMRDVKTVASMTHLQFATKLTEKGADYEWPLLRRDKVTTTKDIMQFAPIPSYLVLDGFVGDIDAAEVYERVLSINNDDVEMYSHLKNFLLACLSAHNAPDNKPYISHVTLLAPPPAEARRWVAQKFKSLFPTLNLPPPPAAAAPVVPNPDLAALIALLQQQQQQLLQGGGNNNIAEEKKDDEEPPQIGMSNRELRSLLAMCGKPLNAAPTLLPDWIQQCSEKGMTDQYKLTIIRKHIMNNFKYDDSEIPLTAPLLKMINKRNWSGKEGNIKRPSLINAVEGLSPFLVMDLNEDAVAKINDIDDAMSKASYVTMQDVKELKKQIRPKVPKCPTKFLLLLKRYANLLYAIFSDDCSLFKCVVTIIDAIKEFSHAAREAMTMKTKASILWIILLQSRQFAIGVFDVLAEFSTMHSALSSKHAIIHHAEVPVELVTPVDDKPDPKDKRQPDPPFEQPKRPRKPNPNTWHPKLREMMAKPMITAQYPTFSAILKYCSANAQEVYAKDAAKCAPNAFFGRCFKGDSCFKDHSPASDSDVNKILQMVDKFIKEPEGLRQG